MKNFREQRGVAILFSLFLISFILASALVLSAIFIPKIRLSFDVKNSPTALFAADTGLEWCFYVMRKSPVSAPTLNNGATITINDVTPPTASDCVSPLKSIGTFKNSSRALEATLR